MYSRTDYMTITLLWHSSKHDSKSQATLRGCYKSSHKVWLIIQGQAAKISWFQHPSWPLKLQIDKSLGLLPFSDAFPIDTSTTQLKWCFDKKRLTSKTPISGVIGCIFFSGRCNNFLQLDCQVLFSMAIRIFRVRTDVWKCLVFETFDSAKEELPLKHLPALKLT